MSGEAENIEPYDPADTPSGAPRRLLHKALLRVEKYNRKTRAKRYLALMQAAQRLEIRKAEAKAAKAAKAAPKP